MNALRAICLKVMNFPLIILGLLFVVAPAWSIIQVEKAKLMAADGAAMDFFGFSVAASEDTVIVGALRDDDRGSDSGSAYVFIKEKGGWHQQAKLFADDGAKGDGFGGKVTLSGDTAIIGAMNQDDNGENAGAAYVFTRNKSEWSQQAKLIANDTTVKDGFGQSIAIFGDTAVIGAPHDDDKGTDSGSVYVFKRSGDIWNQQAKLTAIDGASGDVFGISIAFDGETILVGADLNDEKALNAGAVYVYTGSGKQWKQQAKLTASDGAETDIFGVRVALSGDTALISARRDDDDVMGIDSGSAYVFTRSGSVWTEQAKLTANDGAANDRFGRSVALSGDTALIGAMFQDNKGENSGSAYIFTRTKGIWSQKIQLQADDGTAGDVFGWSMDLTCGTAVIGAARDDENGKEAGSAYVFDLNNVVLQKNKVKKQEEGTDQKLITAC